jgi:hypothetical protein
MDLIDQLQVLATRAQQTGADLRNEESTKMALITPFIQALGYDIFNPAEVMPEFTADLPGIIKAGERVDYAILEGGQPKILIEAKPFNTNLKTTEKGQLSRYFQATKARIGILSNGQLFHFFTDLDAPNLMDIDPFAEVDLLNLKAAPLEEIKKLSKSMFDLDTLLSSAERLKYLSGIKVEIKKELTDPTDWLVGEMASRVHSGKRVTAGIKEQFKPLVIDAIKSYINDRIAERLTTAMQAEQTSSEIEAPKDEEPDESGNGIVTTQEEMEGLYIIRAICATDVDPYRLNEKDTKSYCNVLLDNNSWKSIARLHFNGSQKRIELFDDQEPKMVPIENPSDIYKHSERVRTALRLKLG